jgi:hypothetical protein
LGERQTVAGAYAKIEGHEELCAERYRAIGVELRDIKATQTENRNDLKGMQRAAWALVLALAAWLATQVYGDLKADRTEARRAGTQAEQTGASRG